MAVYLRRRRAVTRQTSQRIAVVYRIDVGSVEAVTPQREFFVVGEGELTPQREICVIGEGCGGELARVPPPEFKVRLAMSSPMICTKTICSER